MTAQPFNDERLIKACSGGNTEAFGALVQKYQSYICAITFSATGSIEKSEEIAQDVFVLAWQNLSQLKNCAKFKSWLYAITKNQIKKFYRTQKRDPIARAAGLENAVSAKDTAEAPPEKAISKERQAFVRESLEKIPANYREPLVLFYREGKSIKQVADVFELSESAAKKRLSRARQMMRSQLSSALEETLSSTRPGKAFTVGVIGLIAVSGPVTKATAAAGTVKAGTNIIGALTQSLTAKITAAAAVVVIGASTATYISSQQEETPAEPVVQILPIEMDKGLVLHLSFDTIEEADGQTIVNDESRTGNNGLLTGGKFVKGRIGEALKCNAKNKLDGVIVKDHDSLDLDAVTIAAWIKTDHKDARWNRILDKGWQTAYNLCISGDDDWQRWRDRTTLECVNGSLISERPIVDGKWHFVAGTYDGWTSRLYIDGKLDSEKIEEAPKPMAHNDVDIMIGRLAVPEAPPSDEAFFDGLIDEIRLYDRVLTARQIQMLYRYQPY